MRIDETPEDFAERVAAERLREQQRQDLELARLATKTREQEQRRQAEKAKP